MAVSAQEPSDDGALVSAVQRGDVDAFAKLFRRHYPDVRRACARRLSDVGEADEVAQAAFVRAFERIHQCTGERRFGPWVHVIARSLCIDAFRARARVEPHEDPLAGRREHRPNDPEESVLRRERAAQVRQALASLPERQRRAVIARDWEELRPGEIAERLGLSVGAVDSLLLRARRRLALSYRHLAGEGGGGASALTVRSAAAAAVMAVALGPHALLAGPGEAAGAMQDTAGRAAEEVVDAVVAVAHSFSRDERRPAPAAESPTPVTAVVAGAVPEAPPPIAVALAPEDAGDAVDAVPAGPPAPVPPDVTPPPTSAAAPGTSTPPPPQTGPAGGASDVEAAPGVAPPPDAAEPAPVPEGEEAGATPPLPGPALALDLPVPVLPDLPLPVLEPGPSDG